MQCQVEVTARKPWGKCGRPGEFQGEGARIGEVVRTPAQRCLVKSAEFVLKCNRKPSKGFK